MFEEKLQQAFADLQIPCTSVQAAQCARYFAMLVEANQTMNLTNVTQEDEAILLHFCDSARLLPVFPLPKGARCIDVGTGAGFPGMVLAILRPDVSITRAIFTTSRRGLGAGKCTLCACARRASRP